MGWSYVDFRGRWFHARDASVDFWICLLADEAEKSAHQLPWLRELASYWREQDEFAGVGCLDCGLDLFVTDEERRLAVLALAERAVGALVSQGAVLSQTWLNKVTRAGECRHFTGDVDRSVFEPDGRRLIRLLRGESPDLA